MMHVDFWKGVTLGVVFSAALFVSFAWRIFKLGIRRGVKLARDQLRVPIVSQDQPGDPPPGIYYWNNDPTQWRIEQPPPGKKG